MELLLWNNPKTVKLLEEIVSNGEVFLGSGDTVFGLLTAVSANGIAKLNAIKHRSGKAYLILVPDHKKALSLIQTDNENKIHIENIMNICWPGPVTLIFTARHHLADYMKSSDGTIALRVPCHEGLLNLMKKCGLLFSTSANSAGASVPTSIEEVEKNIIDSVACAVIDDNRDEKLKALPSTILDCTGDEIKVVRQGAFPVERLACFRK